MKNSIKLAVAALAIGGTIAGTTALALSNQPVYISPSYANNTGYSCASIHFGMDDNTRTGDITGYGTNYGAGKTWDSVGLVSGVTLKQFKVEGSTCQWLAQGTTYKINKVEYEATTTNGFKLGKGASITFTFNETLIGCDVYAVGWNDSNITFTVNDSEDQSVPQNADAAGNFAPISATYTKYHFDFAESNQVVITMAANKRMFIGDIALRIKN